MPKTKIKKCHKKMIHPSFFVLLLLKHPQLKNQVGVGLIFVFYSLAWRPEITLLQTSTDSVWFYASWTQGHLLGINTPGWRMANGTGPREVGQGLVSEEPSKANFLWVLLSDRLQCLLCVSCLVVSTFCNTMDCSPPASSVHGIFQARVLEWVLFPSPGNLP